MAIKYAATEDARAAEAFIPSAATYYNRFGNIRKVYRLLARFPEHPGNRPPENLQSRVNAITYNLSDDDLLNRLRGLLRIHGTLTREIIDANKAIPHSETYVRHFGSMARVYRLIGYDSNCRRARQGEVHSG
jgi:hypothetical protein